MCTRASGKMAADTGKENTRGLPVATSMMESGRTASATVLAKCHMPAASCIKESGAWAKRTDEVKRRRPKETFTWKSGATVTGFREAIVWSRLLSDETVNRRPYT